MNGHFDYLAVSVSLNVIFGIVAVLFFLYQITRNPKNKSRLYYPERRHSDSVFSQKKEIPYTYDDLTRNIVRSMLNTFPIEMAAVYFYDPSKEEFHLRSQEGMKSSLAQNLRDNRKSLAIKKNDPLFDLVGTSKNLVIKEEVMDPVKKTMDRIESSVAAPLLFSGKVMGLLVCGPKKEEFVFNSKELMAIHSFARMGEEVVRYIMGVEMELNHTAVYSHDMNNDTKSLVQTLQFLQSPMASQQPKEKINVLLEQAEDVATRLNQTFELNQDRSVLLMKSMRGEYKKSPIDITQCIRTSCEKYYSPAEKKKIELITKIPDESVIVEGNQNDLVRMLDSLINNAMRFSDPGGKVKVLCEHLPGAFQIFVKDDGRGIDPKEVERIWTRGWQAKDAKQGASGYGLTIARQIVHLHHGQIEVESDGRDKGTVFKILIPLREEPV